MTFGEKLKSLRIMNGIAQADIAEACDVAIFTVSRDGKPEIVFQQRT